MRIFRKSNGKAAKAEASFLNGVIVEITTTLEKDDWLIPAFREFLEKKGIKPLEDPVTEDPINYRAIFTPDDAETIEKWLNKRKVHQHHYPLIMPERINLPPSIA